MKPLKTFYPPSAPWLGLILGASGSALLAYPAWAEELSLSSLQSGALILLVLTAISLSLYLFLVIFQPERF